MARGRNELVHAVARAPHIRRADGGANGRACAIRGDGAGGRHGRRVSRSLAGHPPRPARAALRGALGAGKASMSVSRRPPGRGRGGSVGVDVNEQQGGASERRSECLRLRAQRGRRRKGRRATPAIGCSFSTVRRVGRGRGGRGPRPLAAAPPRRGTWPASMGGSSNSPTARGTSRGGWRVADAPGAPRPSGVPGRRRSQAPQRGPRRRARGQRRVERDDARVRAARRRVSDLRE